ncbi:MAG: DUF5110 domain-containing protein [Bacteroidales bacterium]|nr:DUF5110 domain-containing protein [Bacteroidales bacterium]
MIHIYAGKTKNRFCYYEDDGNTFDYLQGNFCRRNIEYDPEMQQMLISEQEGKYTSKFTHIKCVFHGFQDSIKTLTINGKPAKVSNSQESMINGLRYLQDTYDPQYLSSLRGETPMQTQVWTVFPFNGNAILLGW